MVSHREMKALMLCGGKGTRLKPFTNTTTKHLLPVANKPILFYIMDMIKEAGIPDIGIVVSPQWGGQVKQAIGDGHRWDARVTYIVQTKPAGLAHAVKIARPFLSNSPFLMILGDNIYGCNLADFIKQSREHDTDALLLVKEVSNPCNFGIVQHNGREKVIRVQEKPKSTASNLALAGIYLFSPAIHEAIDRIKPSQRGELEITDAIQKLVELGKRVRVHILEGWWIDTGSPDDLLRANKLALSKFLEGNICGQVDARSRIEGNVEIKESAIIENSKIRGAVSIAEDCFIKNSLIGPFTSIGARTKVEDSSVEGSIIMKECHIYGIKRLADSLIGNKVELASREHKFKALRLFVGDNAKIEF